MLRNNSLRSTIIILFISLIWCSSIKADEVSNPSNDTIPIPSLPQGGQLFRASISVQNSGGTTIDTKTFVSNASITTIINNFKDDDMSDEFPGYDPNSSLVSGNVDLRGVMVTAQVSINGNTRILDFCVTGLGCEQFQQQINSISTLMGDKNNHLVDDTSTESIWNQLEDWLKGQGGSNLLQSLASAWVSQTSIDPVAGNPNSFMAQLTNANFNLATTGLFNGDTTGINLFSVTPSYYAISNNGFNVRSADLPLKWSHYFNQDNALMIDAPINYTQTEGATTYSLALGLGYSHVWLRNDLLTWASVPSIYIGAVGSLDLGSGTLLYNAGLANRLTFPDGKFTFGYTNDFSYLKTAKVTIGSVQTPYDLSDVLTQNGVDVTYRVYSLMTVGSYYTRTDVIGGAAWYIPNYNEVGIKLAKLKTYNSAMYDNITLSAGYDFGPNDYKGGNVTLGFNF